ncbi:leucyl aminopeptidase [Planctomycetaceae bacterium SH139]
MQAIATRDSALDFGGDCLVVGYDKQGFLGPIGEQIDKWLGGGASQCFANGLLDHSSSDSSLVPLPNAKNATSALLLGIAERTQTSQQDAYSLGGRALRQLTDRDIGKVVVSLPDLVPEQCQSAFIAGALAATQGQDLYRTKRATYAPQELIFAGASEEQSSTGIILGDAINFTRKLVNEPANKMYPESFVAEVQAMAAQVGLEVEIWDTDKLEEERCEALLAVGQASTRPSRLLILRHRGGQPNAAPLALVGKGVTFDSGGLSIKPSDGMVDMKCDMAGAATVVGAMQAIAQMGLKQNVFAYCGLVENMIAGNAYKLGDVVRARSGKTIEILNTDAEGRVVLADVLDVACEDKPAWIVDLATLTGACLVALGHDVSGLFSNHDALAQQVAAAAEKTGERVWQLPMFPEYGELIKSNVADIKNVGSGRWAGAITAAKFLENFVQDKPWVHLDIAGPAFADAAKPFRDAGATGSMVRTLVQLVADQPV